VIEVCLVFLWCAVLRCVCFVGFGFLLDCWCLCAMMLCVGCVLGVFICFLMCCWRVCVIVFFRVIPKCVCEMCVWWVCLEVVCLCVFA